MKPINEDPRYQEKVDRLNRLSAAVAQIESRLLELDTLSASSVKKAAIEKAALQFAETGVVAHVTTVASDLQRERESLTGQLEVLKLSINATHQELHEVRQQLSREACQAQMPAHRALAQRMLKLLREIDKVQEDEKQLLQSIGSAGYDAAFPVRMTWPLLGRATDSSGSALFYRLRELDHYAN